MKAFIYTAMVVTLSACGADREVEVIQGPKGDTGAPGEVVIVEKLPNFVGEYYLPYTGYAIINVNHENEYTVQMELQTTNPDNSICSMGLNANTIDLHDGKIVYTGSVNFTAGNCKSDLGSPLLAASGVTYQYEVTISFNDSDLLTVRLLVVQTSAGVRTLVINRTVTEE